MVRETRCINVWSELNPELDIGVIPNEIEDEDYEAIENIVIKAYDDWWDVEAARCETLADWICLCLDVNFKDKYELYFKN